MYRGKTRILQIFSWLLHPITIAIGSVFFHPISGLLEAEGIGSRSSLQGGNGVASWSEWSWQARERRHWRRSIGLVPCDQNGQFSEEDLSVSYMDAGPQTDTHDELTRAE